MSDITQLGRHIGAIDSVIDAWVAQLGLGYNHFAVLYSLAGAENGQCTQKHICDTWLLPKQTVFNICKDYKEKGWITFSESPTDKRERIMRLTADGKAQAEPVLHATERFFQNAFAAFGSKKTAQLFALMREFCDTCRAQAETLDHNISAD